jgi:prefoldin subunit 5
MSYKQIKDLIGNAIKNIDEQIAEFENSLEKLSMLEEEVKATLLMLKHDKRDAECLQFFSESNQGENNE